MVWARRFCERLHPKHRSQLSLLEHHTSTSTNTTNPDTLQKTHSATSQRSTGTMQNILSYKSRLCPASNEQHRCPTFHKNSLSLTTCGRKPRELFQSRRLGIERRKVLFLYNNVLRLGSSRLVVVLTSAHVFLSLSKRVANDWIRRLGRLGGIWLVLVDSHVPPSRLLINHARWKCIRYPIRCIPQPTRPDFTCYVEQQQQQQQRRMFPAPKRTFLRGAWTNAFVCVLLDENELSTVRFANVTDTSPLHCLPKLKIMYDLND